MKVIRKYYRDGVEYRIKFPTPLPDYLCFTANTASSTIQLTKNGSPTVVQLETSTNGKTWTTYTIGNTITLTNTGDKVYMRNKSQNRTLFSTNVSNYYKYVMTGSINASGNINYLLCLDGNTTLVGDYNFYMLFYGCSSLKVPPKLPAVDVGQNGYDYMFYNSGLNFLPYLPATSIGNYGYRSMFNGCANIKLSTTQTGEYQTPYRIPKEGSGVIGGSSWNFNMFANTGGTFTSNPSINTTYYTSNTVV